MSVCVETGKGEGQSGGQRVNSTTIRRARGAAGVGLGVTAGPPEARGLADPVDRQP